MSSKHTISNRFILRIPRLPINVIETLNKSKSISKTLLNFYDEPIIKNAIKLASPNLYEQLEKKINQKSVKNNEELLLSLYKYIVRMGTRPIPFGLFSSVGVGEFSERNDIVLDKGLNFKVALDNSFLDEINEKIFKNHILANDVITSNSSIYVFGEHYRYYRCVIMNGNRDYSLEMIRKSEHLDFVYEKSRLGVSVLELVDLMVIKGFEKKLSEEFLIKLIEIDFIHPILSSSSVGKDNTDLNSIVRERGINDKLETLIKELTKNIELVNKNNDEEKVGQLMDSLTKNIKGKSIIRLDSYYEGSVCKLKRKYKIQISRAIHALEVLGSYSLIPRLEIFKNNFKKRYGQKALRLVDALDPDYGLGYPLGSQLASSEYVDRFSIYGKEAIPVSSSGNDKMLKILKSKNISGIILELTDKDLNSLGLREFNQEPPASFYAMSEIVSLDGRELVYIPGIGGSTAAKTIGRFTGLSNDIDKLVVEILNHEDKFHAPKKVVEVCHNPGGKTGNVIKRQINRKERLTFLDGMTGSREEILITDIFIEISEGRIKLTYGSEKKEMVPYLTNAHNVEKSNLPAYKFLHDYQLENGFLGLSFDWGKASDSMNFLPRVIYKDVILGKAKWIVNINEVELIDSVDFKLWLKKRKISKYVNLVEGDQRFYLDMEVEFAKILILKALKKKKEIILEEFLQHNGNVLTDSNGQRYASQFVFLMSNTKTKPEPYD